MKLTDQSAVKSEECERENVELLRIRNLCRTTVERIECLQLVDRSRDSNRLPKKTKINYLRNINSI